VTGFDTISTAGTVEFFIRGFVNPNAADIGHVYMVVHSEDAGGVKLDSRYVDKVLSTQAITVATPTAVTFTRDANTVQTLTNYYFLTGLT